MKGWLVNDVRHGLLYWIIRVFLDEERGKPKTAFKYPDSRTRFGDIMASWSSPDARWDRTWNETARDWFPTRVVCPRNLAVKKRAQMVFLVLTSTAEFVAPCLSKSLLNLSNFKTFSFLQESVFCSWDYVQGGSNMTGTNCDLFTHNQFRSYLNHRHF